MKKLLYLGIILMLGSCGSSAIKIGNLEVMTQDLGDMTWDDAVKACADLGEGWRLPTNEELNILFENKDKIGGFAIKSYWSSTEVGIYGAWNQYFFNGYQFNDFKFNHGYVRPVRAF